MSNEVDELISGAFPYSFDFLYWEEAPEFRVPGFVGFRRRDRLAQSQAADRRTFQRQKSSRALPNYRMLMSSMQSKLCKQLQVVGLVM